MSLNEFLTKLNTSPEEIEFEETMAVIADGYEYYPTEFTNGSVKNLAGENEGSCKLFYFAKLNKLTKKQTLTCFGKYYREDVLNNPLGKDHQNIRSFIQCGWDGIKFVSKALQEK